jgi:phosphoserine phosphatase RsbU/P
MKNKGLAFQLSFSILSFVSLIFILLIYYNYRTTERIMKNDVRQEINSIIETSVLEIQNKLKEIENFAINYSFLSVNKPFVDENKIKYGLNHLSKRDPLIIGSSITIKSSLRSSEWRSYHYSLQLDTLTLINDIKFYKNEELLDKSKKWSDPYCHELHQMIVTSYSVPLYNIESNNKIFKGILKVDVPFYWIDSIVSNIKIYKTGQAILTTRNGLFIAHQNKSYVGKRTLDDVAREYNIPGILDIRDSIQLIKSGEFNIESYFEDIKNIEKGFYTYRPILNNGWSLILQFKEKEYLSELNNLTKQLVLYGGSGLLALFVLCFLIINKLTGPIRQLSQMTDDMRKGNFNILLPETSSQDEAGRISASIKSMQDELKKYIKNLEQTITEKERIESDIRIASEIQSNLIPSTFPDPSDLGGIDIYGKVIPAKFVSGDLFDFRKIDDDHIYFIIGDVTGKGVPASLFMAITRTLMISESKNQLNPEKIMEAVNNQLCENNKNSMFVTAILGIIQLSTGKTCYCNAGHNYPYLKLANGELKRLEDGSGLPLGILPDQIYETKEFVLEKNSFFFTYSDGVTEAENSKEEFYGDDRLKDFIFNECMSVKSSQTLVSKIITNLELFIGDIPNSDDITVLVLSK